MSAATDIRECKESVVAAAELWWRNRRHPADSECEQIAKDTAYTGYERDAERLLARNIAHLVKLLKERQPK